MARQRIVTYWLLSLKSVGNWSLFHVCIWIGFRTTNKEQESTMMGKSYKMIQLRICCGTICQKAIESFIEAYSTIQRRLRTSEVRRPHYDTFLPISARIFARFVYVQWRMRNWLFSVNWGKSKCKKMLQYKGGFLSPCKVREMAPLVRIKVIFS